MPQKTKQMGQWHRAQRTEVLGTPLTETSLQWHRYRLPPRKWAAFHT